jgi:hypothetical protein
VCAAELHDLEWGMRKPGDTFCKFADEFRIAEGFTRLHRLPLFAGAAGGSLPPPLCLIR